MIYTTRTWRPLPEMYVRNLPDADLCTTQNHGDFLFRLTPLKTASGQLSETFVRFRAKPLRAIRWYRVLRPCAAHLARHTNIQAMLGTYNSPFIPWFLTA